MKKIAEAFHKKTSGKNIIILVIVLILFFCISLPLLNAFASEYMSLPALDHPIIYSQNEIFTIIDNWGQSGRIWQIVFHLTWDLILPVLSIMLFGYTISWLTQRCFDKNSKMQKLHLIAFLYSLDFLENITIEILAISYPAKFKIAAILNIFSSN